MIFVDTGAWYANVIPSDPNYAAALDWLAMNQELFITTDYLIDETLTLLKARGHFLHALALGDKLFRGEGTTIH